MLCQYLTKHKTCISFAQSYSSIFYRKFSLNRIDLKRCCCIILKQQQQKKCTTLITWTVTFGLLRFLHIVRHSFAFKFFLPKSNHSPIISICILTLKRKKHHIHKMFAVTHCYNYAILLLVGMDLCAVYKPNYITAMFVEQETPYKSSHGIPGIKMPMDTKPCRWSSPCTHTHLLIYFKSYLGYLPNLAQHKCYVIVILYYLGVYSCSAKMQIFSADSWLNPSVWSPWIPPHLHTEFIST